MLRIRDNKILGYSVTGNIGYDFYTVLIPVTHESGAAWWIIDPSGDEFIDADGQTYHIRKRTQAEIEATPEFIAWQAAKQIDASQAQAKVDMGAVPAWMKTFTAAQAESYIETNVTTLATAKVVLKIMARMLVLMRDHTRFTA